MRHLRKLMLLASFALVAATLSPAAAYAKANGTDRPLTGASRSTTTIDLLTGTGTSDGTSQLSHCGRTTFHNDFTFSLGGDTFTLQGTDTEVCANGDEISSTFVVVGSVGTGESTGTFTITGGTGRFANASGSFTIDATSTNVVIDGTVLTSDDTNTIDGSISY